AYALTYYRNLYIDFKQVIPLIVQVGEAAEVVYHEFSKLVSCLEGIPDSSNVSYDAVKELKDLVDINTIPIKEQRDQIIEFQKDFLSNLFNENNYPMNGYDFKQELMKIKPLVKSV